MVEVGLWERGFTRRRECARGVFGGRLAGALRAQGEL
jgi:hypothetical protein